MKHFSLEFEKTVIDFAGVFGNCSEMIRKRYWCWILGVACVAGDVAARTWTDAETGRTIEADLLAVQDDSVRLRRTDGKEFEVRLDMLSEADQAFARAQKGKLGGGGGDWPTWRGPERTNRSPDQGLLKSWPDGGPKLLWTFADGGKGYSAPVIADGRLYFTGTRRGQAEIIGLDVATGKEVWSGTIGPDPEKGYSTGWGAGTRGAPTVDDGMIYAMSARGILGAFDLRSGKKLWSKHLVDDLGGGIPGWGYSESPLVDGNRLVVTPGGGQGAIAALDKKSGKLLWRSEEVKDGAQYASITIAESGGAQHYVQLFMNKLVGVDPRSGDLNWSVDWPSGRTAVIPTPVPYEDKVYMTSGYGSGCQLISYTANGAKVLWENKVMKNHHGGVVRVGDYLYGFSDGAGLLCQNFKTGERVWSERGRDTQKGAVHYADGMLYCLDESNGSVFLVEATPDGYREHGRFQLPAKTTLREGTNGKIWTHPVVIGGKLYLRDQDHVFCYEVKGG